MTATSILPSLSSSISRAGVSSVIVSSMPGWSFWKRDRKPTQRSGPIVHMMPRLSGASFIRRKLLAVLLTRLGVLGDLLELRPHQLAEIGQVGGGPLAPEQQPAEFRLQLLDGAGQRRLRHVAALGRPREVQGIADRQEIADLMHLHPASLLGR